MIESKTVPSRKRFSEAAKKVKRKQYLTGAEARDLLARGYGFTDFKEMNLEMMKLGEWK